MQLTDVARHLPEAVWHLFQPLLPPVVWCGNGRLPARNSDCLPAVFSVLVSGSAWRRLPTGFPSYKTVRRRRAVWLPLDTCRTAWQQLASRYEALPGIHGDQLLLDGANSRHKGGEQTGPSPVERGQCGTAFHLAGDARARPLGAVVTVEARSMPRAQADGADGNQPTPARAQRAGCRLPAPQRGQRQPGVGPMRHAVERCHNFFAQFGRVFRRFDRSVRRYLAWIDMAACVILLRSGFVS